MDAEPNRVRPEDLDRFCRQAMRKAGLRDAEARISADVLVTTDTWGVHTHGTKQLRKLLGNFRDGKMDLTAATELEEEGQAWALFDGRHSMPMVSATMAMGKAIELARKAGIAYAGVRDSGHFGAAGYYANMAAREGMIGISMCNVDPGVAVPGSRGSVLGTNPLSYAVPAPAGRTVFLDIATSVVAASKILAAQDAGEMIPEGWLIDAEGLPTTDPAGYPLRGALLPFGGHKGYGISLLIEVLTGVLNRGAFGSRVTSWIIGDKPVNQSFAFIAIDIGAFMPVTHFLGRMDVLISQIRNAPKARGARRIYLPGEREWECREIALASGMVLPPDVMASLRGLAEDYSLDISSQLGLPGDRRS